jgi:hypothetical protein
MNKNPKNRQNNIVVQEMENEILIYDLTTNKAFCLNETSALIWQLCDGNKSVPQIVEHLNRKLKSSVNEDLVWLALDQLRREKLVSDCDGLETKFSETSRREVIKRVGMSTMIALPLISSLIAPHAVNAQSAACNSTSGACTVPTGRPNGCCCQNGPECQSGNCIGIGGGQKACRP